MSDKLRTHTRAKPLRVLQAVLVLLLAFSMSVYWEGIVRAYPIPTNSPLDTAHNPGLPLSFPYQPIVKPQPQVSTLLQEFPSIDPSYAEQANSFIFHTTFGDYSFSKTQPWMSFTYRDGTPLVSHSVFYVNSSFQAPIILSNYTIDTPYLDNHHFRYSANLRSLGNQVGTLQVSFVFDRVQRPKITVHVNPTAELAAQGFNVLWVLRGFKTFARLRNGPAGVDFGNYTTVRQTASNETRFELGLGAHPEAWRLSALVDWGDSSLGAKIAFGRFPLLGFLSGPVSLVTFPANVGSIDPTIVGQSSVSYGSAQSFQRHTFWDGTNYWAFYYNGSNTVYEYSSDSRTWNNPVGVLWSYAYTAIWYNSGSVYALAGTSASGTTSATAYLYFRKGTLNGASINWGSIVTVDSKTYTDSTAVAVWVNFQDPNLVVGTDGLITAIYTLMTESKIPSSGNFPCQLAFSHTPGSTVELSLVKPANCPIYTYSGTRTLLVKKSLSSDGASWSASTTIISDSTYGSNYYPTLSALANGVVLAVFSDSATGAIKYARSTAWTTVTQVDSGGAGSHALWFGSVSNSTHVHLAYDYADSTIRYRYWFNGTWSSPLTIASATSISPTISFGYRNSLNVLYLNSNLIYYRQYTMLHGWGTTLTPFNATSFVSPAYLSSGSDSTNGFLISLWTEGTAAPYTVKFSSLPVTQQVWSPYSDPWDQEGVIPYGEYYRNLQEYVSPYNGLLTITQPDFSLPGRGFGDVGALTVARIFRTPYGSPYTYENYPYANLGLGWSLDWPWIGTNYLHLKNGQGYKINLVNNKFENHQGEQFVLTLNGDGTYTLIDQSGTIYKFSSAKKLTSILDRTQNNTITFNYNTQGISQITDAVGRAITLAYDSNNRVKTVTSGGRIWTYTYNTNGNLISVKDPVGRVTSYEYTSSYGPSYLTKITYPTGAYTTYTYAYTTQIGTEAKQLRVNQQTVYLQGGTLVRQETFSYTVDPANSLTTSTITFSDGTSVQGYVNYVFAPSNATITTENAQAQPIRKAIKQYNPNGQVNQLTVYPSGSGANYANLFNFDGWGNVVYQRLAINATSYEEIFSSYTNATFQNHFVDFNGNNATFTCPTAFYVNNKVGNNIHDRVVGRVVFPFGVLSGGCGEGSFSLYDGSGNLLQEKNLLGSSTWLATNYTYDKYGNDLKRLDPKGNQTTYQYSSTYGIAYVTQVSNIVSGLNYSTRYAYNFTTGDRISVTSLSGNVTNFAYDMIDRLTSITYPAISGVRAQRRTVYDDINLVQTAYDQNNNYTKYYYDGLGRVTGTQTYANGTNYSSVAVTFYWNDKPKTYTDPTGNVTTYSYDFLGRILTLTNPDGTFKQWSYNDAANQGTQHQVTAYDEKAHPTDYYYDWLNRLVTVTEHISGQNYNTAHAYDTIGNTVQVTDSKNQITSYTYDSLNRLTQTNFPDNTAESRAYDNVGNLIQRTTQNNTIISYSYDEINRLTRINYPDGSTVTYAYDKDSNRLQMVDSASTTTYTYDPRGRLLSESRTINGQAYTLGYQYDAASNLIRLTYPDGYQLSYTYDALNRITGVGNLASSTYRKNNELASVSYGNGVQTIYSYDQLGRTTRIRTWNNTMTLLDLNYAYDPNGNPTGVNSGQESYGYDDMNRLTSAIGPFRTWSYSYDQVGNRLGATVNGTATNYAYGSYNKLLSAGSTTYAYDNNGNTIIKSMGSDSWSYAYDYENRLKQVKDNGQLIFQAMYDGDGRRIETITSVKTFLYHYFAGSWDPLYMKDVGAGVTTDVMFADSFRVGKILGNTAYYYHLDRMGNVRLVTQNANLQTFTTKYLPYGTAYSQSGTETFQYTGKQSDSSTGLFYYGYRYYDSQVGRFISLDEHANDPARPQTINRYSYALNNPTFYGDPDGHMLTMFDLQGGGGGAGGLIALAILEGLLAMDAAYSRPGSIGIYEGNDVNQLIPDWDKSKAQTAAAIVKVIEDTLMQQLKDIGSEKVKSDAKLAAHRYIEGWEITKITRQNQYGDFNYAGPRYGGHLANKVLFQGPIFDPDALEAQVDFAIDHFGDPAPTGPPNVPHSEAAAISDAQNEMLGDFGTPDNPGFHPLPAGEPFGTVIDVGAGSWFWDGHQWEFSAGQSQYVA